MNDPHHHQLISTVIDSELDGERRQYIDVWLKEIRAGIEVSIAEENFANPEVFQLQARMIGERFSVQMRLWLKEYAMRVIAEEPNSRTRTVSFPLNWFEAVKDRFLPGWMKRRWPVKFKRITIYAAVAVFHDPRMFGAPSNERFFHLLIREREEIVRN